MRFAAPGLPARLAAPARSVPLRRRAVHCQRAMLSPHAEVLRPRGSFRVPRPAARGACGSTVQLGLGGSSAGIAVTLCGSDSQCPSGQHCCGITGTCFDAAHAALCVLPPPGTSRACLTDADCPFEGDYCSGDGCDSPGGCKAATGSCGPLLAPVCGCDGQAYVNAQCADSVGMRVASTGACP